MSLGTIVAFISGFLVIMASIMSATDKPAAFIDIPSMLVVGGGTFVALFISYETKVAMRALKVMGSAFSAHNDSNQEQDQLG